MIQQPNMKKILCIILDGAADVPYTELDNKTPLEAAETPNIDAITKRGITGMMYPINETFAPESDSAAISLLGYDVLKSYTGRGPLEAIGAGLDMQDGDLAFRVNFATIDNNNVITSRRVCRDLSDAEAVELAESVNKEIRLTNPPSTAQMCSFRQYRGVLLISRLDGSFSGNISNVDPGYIKKGVFGTSNPDIDLNLKPCAPLDTSEEACKAADVTNEFVSKARIILENHPVNKKRAESGKAKANIILTRDAGDSVPKFQNINEKYGARFGFVGEMACEIGVGMLMGMKLITVKGEKTNEEKYRDLASRILEELKDLDVIYLHLKGPDSPGHDGDIYGKIKAIEQIDKYFFGSFLPSLGTDTLLVVTSDHATPCYIKTHSAEPVPLLISGAGVIKDKVDSFDEKACKEGSLGFIKGQELMPRLIDIAKG